MICFCHWSAYLYSLTSISPLLYRIQPSAPISKHEGAMMNSALGASSGKGGISASCSVGSSAMRYLHLKASDCLEHIEQIASRCTEQLLDVECSHLSVNGSWAH